MCQGQCCYRFPALDIFSDKWPLWVSLVPLPLLLVMNPRFDIDLTAFQMHLCHHMRLRIGNASEMDSGQRKAHMRAVNFTMFPSELGAFLADISDPGSMP